MWLYVLILIFLIVGLIIVYMYNRGTLYKTGKKCDFKRKTLRDVYSQAEYRLLVSAQCSNYQDWQCVGLQYSKSKYWPAAEFTRLCSCDKICDYKYSGITPTIFTKDWAVHPKTKDRYPPYNRPAGLVEYTQTEHINLDTFLVIIDPDTIILKPLDDLNPQLGRPVAQLYEYLNNENVLQKLATEYGCTGVQAVGMPIIIHAQDLKQLAPLWLDYTEKLRSRQRSMVGWIAEMYSYCLAAADLKLKHTVRNDLSSRPPYKNVVDPYILHYDLTHSAFGYQWDKMDHRHTDMLTGNKLIPEARYPPNKLFASVAKILNDALTMS